MLNGTDWSEFEYEDKSKDPLKYFQTQKYYGGYSPLNLGIYTDGTYKNDNLSLYTSQYIGIMPLTDMKSYERQEEIVEIRPRFDISPTEMLDTVLKGDDYYEHPDMLSFGIFNASELSEIGKSRDNKTLCGVVTGLGKIDISPPQSDDKLQNHSVIGSTASIFEVIRFISGAKAVCKKALKKQSGAHEENLNSKVKGRILMNKQVKYNLSTGQFQKTYCSYNVLSENIKENQIIKYALHLCSKLDITVCDALAEDIAFCKRALADVPLVKCTAADFAGLKNNGAFRQYKDAIYMAKKIIGRYYISYEKTSDGKTEEIIRQAAYKTEPFFIDMNLLFEYYCRALVRKAIDELDDGLSLDAPNINKPLFAGGEVSNYFMNTYIPDIVIRKKNDNSIFAVIDAKYSDVRKQEKRSRTHQILFYMNALDCNAGGLMGIDDSTYGNKAKAAIAGSYMYDGKNDMPSRQRLLFIPVSENSGYTVEIIKETIKQLREENNK